MKNQEISQIAETNQQICSSFLLGPIYDPSVFTKHLWLTVSGVVYSQNYLKQPSTQFLLKHQVKLPERSRSGIKTLFLDMDETLIHGCLPGQQAQMCLSYCNEFGKLIHEGINIRPHLIETLTLLKQSYDIYIFSAASPNYCNAIVNYVLDPKHELISGILSRTYCLQTKNGYYIKDLRIIANRELNEMVIVDNLSHSFGFQLSNGVPIISWYGDSRDQELKFLGEYLTTLSKFEDIPLVNAQKFQFEALTQLFLQFSNVQ